METAGWLALLAAVTAFCGGCAVAMELVGAYRSGSRASQVQGRALQQGGLSSRIMRNGIGPLKPLAHVFWKIDPVRAFAERQALWCRSRGMTADGQALVDIDIGAMLVSALLGWVLASSWVFGLAAAGCLAAGASAALGSWFDRRAERVRESVPDVLRTMSTCFHAGFTLQQTFGQVADEAAEPLAGMFLSARDALKAGRSIPEVLEDLRRDSAVKELSFVVVALAVQHKTGGSMQAVLDSACDSLENELALRRSLRVQTAQAKLSARVVSAVTVALVALLSLLTEDFLAPFFQSAVGMVMLAMALCMQVGGVLAVRRLLKVEVD